MATGLANRAARLPVIVVLGATGTGKSKLALEIAVRFKGEIISADSMQVYRGLDIITNKVTTEEASLAPHHLLSLVDPLARFTVTDFRNAALPVIQRLKEESKVPVIVGGTNYYIESLLWKVLIDGVSGDGKLMYDRDFEVYMGGEKRGQRTDRHVPKRTKVCGDAGDGGGASEGVSASAGGENGAECAKSVVRGDSGGGENGDKECTKSGDVSGDRCGDGGGDSTKSDVVSGDNAKECGDSSSGGENDDKVCAKSEVVCDRGSVGVGGVVLSVWQDTLAPTQELYGRLCEVDPEIATTYHPNERRKIIRSLQVWEQTGRPHSQLLEAQREQEGGSGLGGALRYPEAVILWVTCEQEVLLARLDARVEEMLARGLVKELLDFHAAYNTRRLREGGTQDYTKGIFQSIGFKEFHDFLVLPEGEREGEEGRRLYEAGVAAMKLATRQYTKRQLRWIKNRFLTPSDRKVPPLYMLDATDPTQWETRVGGPAQAVVQAMVEGRVPDLKPANPQSDPDGAGKPRNNKSRHECEVCGRVLIGEHIWQDHLRGAKHRKMLKRKAQQQQAVGEPAPPQGLKEG